MNVDRNLNWHIKHYDEPSVSIVGILTIGVYYRYSGKKA